MQIELLEGWNGPIITNETLFIVLDGMAVYGAVIIFHFIHPGKYMPKASATVSDELDDARLPVYSNGQGREVPQAQSDYSMEMDARTEHMHRDQEQSPKRYYN